MSLTLALRNVSSLSDGGPIKLQLDRRGAVIGRSPTVEWTLPDPSNYISSRHCEVRYETDFYQLRDTSTNGTMINGAMMTGPHRLVSGDVITIGHYEIAVTAPGPAPIRQDTDQDWGGWKDVSSAVNDPNIGSDWGKPKPKAPIAGDGLIGGNWVPPVAGAPKHAASDGWGPASTPPQESPNPFPAPAETGSEPWGANVPGSDWKTGGSSNWSSAPAAPPIAPTGRDIWGEMEQSHSVDWSRSSFGVAHAPKAPEPLGLTPLAGVDALGPLPGASPFQPAFTAQQQSDPAAATPATASDADALLDQIAPLLGLSRSDLRGDSQRTLATMATLLRTLVSGLVVMVEARARAKAQLGAQTTILQFDGNNPIKFARTPEQALLQLLNAPERGYVAAEQAIEDSFVDLQSHQMATLRAMQGALRATLDRFSPKAISDRVQDKGLLSQIMPAKRDAALWRAYEREFSGVNQGSDEAFMDVFAREFRKAYEEEVASKRR